MTATITTSPARERLRQAIAASEMATYVYSYPSKRAYRQVEPPRTLADVWVGYSGPINLYLHVPFCGYRCSFCTLFLTTDHTPELRDEYVAALRRQISVYGELLPDVEVVSVYIGGGTPTTLTPRQFDAVFGALHDSFPRFAPDAEVGVEGSPDTMTAETLAALLDLGVNRVSMGIQTLDEEELRRVGRGHTVGVIEQAVEAIARTGFDNVNYDLIYGLEGQTRETWLDSLSRTVDFGPQTLTLYPIVFRPLTAIAKKRARDQSAFLENESKYALYDESADYLHARGFRQDSFVRFTTLDHDGYQQEAADFSGVPLVGLGAGARSYANSVHYGTEFAVRKPGTLGIIAGFVDHEHRPDERVGLGFVLDGDEQRRRFCILQLSLGQLDPRAYARRFGDASSLASDFGEELDALAAEGCVERDGAGVLRLTRKGLKFSNVVATLFKSPAVAALEDAFVPA
jgi:oxygen-independent coproporphyrinogen III oxidase